MWHRPRRRPAGPLFAGDAGPCPRRSRRGRAQGSVGGRRCHGGRRGRPLPAESGADRDSRGGARDVLPARGLAAIRGRGRMPGRRPATGRVARGADPKLGARGHGPGVAAQDRAAHPGPLGASERRAPCVPRAAAGGAGSRRLRRVALVSHRHVQGALRRGAVGAVLSRSRRSGARGPVRDLPPALLDQHRAKLGAGAAVPAHLPQRRDQHDRRQRHLAGGTAARARRRSGARARPRRQRLRLGAARQRARAARPWPGRGHRRGAVRPRSARVAERPSSRRRRTRLPSPRGHAQRALGRPGGAVLHGRSQLRRRARSERPPSASRRRRRGRAPRCLLRGRGGAVAGRPARATGAFRPWRHPDARSRPRPAGRRGAPARHCPTPAVPRLGRAQHRPGGCGRAARAASRAPWTRAMSCTATRARS